MAPPHRPNLRHPRARSLDPAFRAGVAGAVLFVHPDWARRGIGRAILTTCETAILAAGFHAAELVATLAGEPLYAAFGYTATERFDIQLSNGLPLPAIRMWKNLAADVKRQN